jgi:hypothetical protein
LPAGRPNCINPGIAGEHVEVSFKHNLAGSAVLKHIFAASLSTRLISAAEGARTDHEIQPIEEEGSTGKILLCIGVYVCY